MKITAASFKRSKHVPPNLQQAIASPRLHWRLLDTPGQVWVSLLWGHCSFSWVLVHTRFCLCPPRVCFPILCRFWWLYGRVNGDLLQDLCHMQFCCTQSPCPCGSPLLTRTSTGDIQTQFCLSLCGVSGSWCTEGLFEPSECLWWKWGLILNVIFPLLPSCWGFSALGRGVSPHSCSRAMQPHNDLHFQGTRCHFFFFFCGMWDLGSWTRNGTHAPLQWKCGVLITGPPRKSQGCQFEHYYQGK